MYGQRQKLEIILLPLCVCVCVCVCVCKSLSRVQLFASPWIVACEAPLSVEFSRQRYWSRLAFPSPGDLPNPGIKPRFSALQAYSLPENRISLIYGYHLTKVPTHSHLTAIISQSQTG